MGRCSIASATIAAARRSARRWHLPALNWRRIGADRSRRWRCSRSRSRDCAGCSISRSSASSSPAGCSASRRSTSRRSCAHIWTAPGWSASIWRTSAVGLRTLPWVDQAARAAQLAARPEDRDRRADRGGALERRRAGQCARRPVPERVRASCRPSCRSSRARRAPSRRSPRAIWPTQGRLTEVGLRLAALRLDARGAWSLTLDNGVIVRLGRQQIDRALRALHASRPQSS